MKIHTYVDLSVPSRTNQTDLINLWRASWSKHGWEPRVIYANHVPWTAADRQNLALMSELPTVNHPRYELACYARWLAMAKMGGGWMCDADLMNYGFRPEAKPIEEALIKRFGTAATFDPHKIVSCDEHVPCLVFGTPGAYEGMARRFSAAGEVYNGRQSAHWKCIQQMGGRPHTSDMLILSTLERNVEYIPIDLVKECGEEGWRDSNLVHFSSGRCAGTDKVRVIMEQRSPL